MRQAKIVNLDLNGTWAKTENVIPTEVNDLTDGNEVVKTTNLGSNLQVEQGIVSVKKASEVVAGGLYYWEDQNGYWHLTTTDPEAQIEIVDNPTGQTAIVDTRSYTIVPNATGETVIL